MAYSGTAEAVLSNYSEALKTYYLPMMQEQLNEETILCDLIDVNETDVSGKNATIECHYGRTGGIGARLDGGALPSAAYQKFKTMTVPMRYNYGRVAFSGPTIAATRDEKGAYARVMDTEIRGVVNDVKQEVNRQLWGNGYSILARWNANGSSSITVDKAYRSNTNGDGFGCTFGGKYFEEFSGVVPVEVATLSSAAATDFVVGGTDLVAGAITSGTTTDAVAVTTDDDLSAGDWLARPGNLRTVVHTSAAGYARKEMMGLRGICTNTNVDDSAVYDSSNGVVGLPNADALQGLDIDTYSWWKANLYIHSGGTRYGGQRALSFELMQQAFDKTEEKAGKDYGPDLIITTRALRREYLNLCQADRRMVNTMTLDGGWKALDYNGVPLVVDNDAIDGEIYFLTTKDLQIYRMSDYDWMSKDGSVLNRVTGYDAYEAVLFRYAELGCKRRNSQTVLCDLSYTAT